MISIEVWKDVVGYEGLYEVSSKGSVRSVSAYRPFTTQKQTTKRYHSGKVLKPVFDGRGLYQQVSLSKEGVSKKFLIHRLVASAFIPNPNGLPEVNHKDENKTNNAIENLEWCDHIYNNSYGSKAVASRGERNSQARFNADFVRKVRLEFIPHDPERGLTALANKYGISRSHLCSILKGNRWGWLE